MSEGIRGRNMMYAQKMDHLPDGIKTKDDLVDLIKNKVKPDRYAVIVHNKETDEDGKIKDADIHAMLCFKNACRITSIAKKLGDKAQYIQIWNGAVNNGFSYLLHRTEKAKAEGKHQYSPDDVTANFDFLSLMQRLETRDKLKQYQVGADSKYTIDELLNALYLGVMSKEAVEKQMTGAQYGRYRRQIEDVWRKRLQILAEEWREKMAAQGRQVKVIWIYGASGVGKTRMARAYAEKLGQSYYMTGSSRDLFQNYKGEHTLIIDELRPNVIPYQDLLRLLDPYGEQVMAPSRYIDKALACDVIIITTPYDPFTFYIANFINKSPDGADQLMRRITLSIRMTHECIERIRFREEWDTLLGMAFKDVLEESVANPYVGDVHPTENAKCDDLFHEIVGGKNAQSNTPPQGRTAEKEI